jgi:hypothetical protein
MRFAAAGRASVGATAREPLVPFGVRKIPQRRRLPRLARWWHVRLTMNILTGLVYIYSASPTRTFRGCGALIEGGYVATCRHVWRDATTRTNGETGAATEVEIQFPYSQDKNGAAYTSRTVLADACEGPEGPAPDLCAAES